MDSHVEHLLRELAPQVLGAVIRRYRDFASAEDAVQEALAAAAQQWPQQGIPENPRGWLIQVAMRRMTDIVRSESARRRRENQAALEAEQEAPSPEEVLGQDQDDTLVLLLMCCHDSLSPASAIALTLRAVGGLTTAELAKAFFVPEATMAQRISRAKATIQASGVPFSMPEDLRPRMRLVLHVLYLIFNEGYTSSSGPELQRTDLAQEAIRLARVVRHILPHEPEVTGLLALMLLTDVRREARTGAQGELIPLTQQDRSRWNPEQITEGVALVTEALSQGAAGPYQLQAAIAALHDEAARVENTDWPQILALYELLKRMSDNPMVALNHAIAVAMVHGPAKGLTLLSSLENDSRLKQQHRLDAARAHLLEMTGDRAEAIQHYLKAAERTTNIPERNYLTTQAARLRDAH